jgi:histidine triad (HIT) family protein
LYPLSSIFTKIVNGEIPCYKIAEDENYLAFLDVNPNAKGHTLCIQNSKLIKYLIWMKRIILGIFSRKIAITLEQAVLCKRIGMSVIGLEVPHTRALDS